MNAKIEPGDKAPNFALTSHTGDKITLNEVLKSKRGAVLAFYLLDFTGDEEAG